MICVTVEEIRCRWNKSGLGRDSYPWKTRRVGRSRIRQLAHFSLKLGNREACATPSSSRQLPRLLRSSRWIRMVRKLFTERHGAAPARVKDVLDEGRGC